MEGSRLWVKCMTGNKGFELLCWGFEAHFEVACCVGVVREMDGRLGLRLGGVGDCVVFLFVLCVVAKVSVG